MGLQGPACRPRRSRSVNGGTPETTYYVYDAGGQRVRKVTERQEAANADAMKERIYLGGFEIYREYDGDGSTVSLERETLHVMDDKQRIALVETRTQGDDGSAGTAHPLPVRQPPRLGQPGAGRRRRRSSPTRSITPTAARRIRRCEASMKAARSGIGIRGRSGMRRRGCTITGRGITCRLGRWSSCDPKMENSISESPYVAMANNPVTQLTLQGEPTLIWG